MGKKGDKSGERGQGGRERGQGGRDRGQGGGERGQGGGRKLDAKKTTDVNNNVNTFCFPTGFKCLYTNADCLSNKIEELRNIVKNSKPLIIAVTETKPKHQRYTLTPAELAIEKYEMFYTPLDSTEGRGCMMYIHRDLNPTEASFETKVQPKLGYFAFRTEVIE